MSRIARLILVLAILLLGLVFHLKNNQTIELHYYLGSIELSLSLLVVLVLCVGSFLGVMASLPIIIRLKRSQMKLQKQIQNSEKEINTVDNSKQQEASTEITTSNGHISNKNNILFCIIDNNSR